AMEAEQPATAERRVEDSDDIESEARVQSAPGESAEVDRSVAPEALEAASTEGAEEAEEAEEAEGNADARPSSSGEPHASSYRGGLPANGNIPMQSMAAPVPLQRATPSG